MGKARDVGGQVMGKTHDMGTKVREKVSDIGQEGKPEDIAHQTGESIGRGLRKVTTVLREMGSGFSKGMRGEEEPEKRMEPSKSSEAVRGQRPQEETTEEREDTSEENPPELYGKGPEAPRNTR